MRSAFEFQPRVSIGISASSEKFIKTGYRRRANSARKVISRAKREKVAYGRKWRHLSGYRIAGRRANTAAYRFRGATETAKHIGGTAKNGVITGASAG